MKIPLATKAAAAALAAATLLCPSAAQAQPVPPSPEMFTLYAKMGALQYGEKLRAEGDNVRACLAWRHLSYIEQREGTTSADSMALTERLLASVCPQYWGLK